MTEKTKKTPEKPETAALNKKPAPESVEKTGDAAAEAPRPDPTRFGDWEKNGRCIDF
ncbi:MAG: DUF1674 domain-containing protein [Rhodospirillales bacterium]|jgi:hypothetical protein|nr:DUF1674 domain-containing protein [Rhodospirillales bacterium]MBT4005898.1 DUF1674 domain-containing protein [Rhodospirillales bacterium]MBT5076210.1 DUF1674 domain-containing protein [Rhodospirillales bacterium]MBT5112581.1 DUF1674 domain-containing protein [Rhodospirillales bacterium]MBT5672105.1 DUF1674 domain-containing protein [Rhodospirillales bacterium]